MAGKIKASQMENINSMNDIFFTISILPFPPYKYNNSKPTKHYIYIHTSEISKAQQNIDTNHLYIHEKNIVYELNKFKTQTFKS